MRIPEQVVLSKRRTTEKRKRYDRPRPWRNSTVRLLGESQPVHVAWEKCLSIHGVRLGGIFCPVQFLCFCDVHTDEKGNEAMVVDGARIGGCRKIGGELEHWTVGVHSFGCTNSVRRCDRSLLRTMDNRSLSTFGSSHIPE